MSWNASFLCDLRSCLLPALPFPVFHCIWIYLCLRSGSRTIVRFFLPENLSHLVSVYMQLSWKWNNATTVKAFKNNSWCNDCSVRFILKEIAEYSVIFLGYIFLQGFWRDRSRHLLHRKVYGFWTTVLSCEFLLLETFSCLQTFACLQITICDSCWEKTW